MHELHIAPLHEIPSATLYRILWLRVSVFVVEQQAAYSELDGRELEPDATLLWVEDDRGGVVATARVLLDEPLAAGRPVARVGRVATASSARGHGLAADLMRAAVEFAEGRWPGVTLALDAQAHLADWYGQFGFLVCGPGFVEDDIPHVPMKRATTG